MLPTLLELRLVNHWCRAGQRDGVKSGRQYPIHVLDQTSGCRSQTVHTNHFVFKLSHIYSEYQANILFDLDEFKLRACAGALKLKTVLTGRPLLTVPYV